MIDWTSDDVARTLRSLPGWWDMLSDGVDDTRLDTLRASAMSRVEQLDGPDDAAAAAVMADVSDALSRAGRLVAEHTPSRRSSGTVSALHTSDGGVPKHPVPSAEIGLRGLVGDRQGVRKHHGSPWQAVCLWSSEVIAALAAEGHPVGPGCTGENVTVEGLDWGGLRPGARMRIGDHVLLELSLPATPCKKNGRWFLDGDFMQMSHERHPGRSRWYAWVRETGVVRTGDAVVVEP